MNTFEVYKVAKQEHLDKPAELEMLRSTYLQKAWADKKCAQLEVSNESDRETATIEWMLELGDWFRTNILEAQAEPGKESPRTYFLRLFDTDPEAAVDELDALFMKSRH